MSPKIRYEIDARRKIIKLHGASKEAELTFEEFIEFTDEIMHEIIKSGKNPSARAVELLNLIRSLKHQRKNLQLELFSCRAPEKAQVQELDQEKCWLPAYYDRAIGTIALAPAGFQPAIPAIIF